MQSYYRALTIAGSDSGGGAGIQADLKTFSALGCFGMSAITALTAQNTCAVTGIFPVPGEFVGEQIDAVLSDIGTDAVKIGMLHSPEVICMVAEKMVQWQCPNIVLDPVMISKSGDNLLREDAVQALKTRLIPGAFLITPNLPEASALLGRKVRTREQMPGAAKDLAGMGCANVLLKGGHLEGSESCDILYQQGTEDLIFLPCVRIRTPNSHGTGCSLSAAICAGLARGMTLKAAVQEAKVYITGALATGAGHVIGKGHGPVNHFYRLWPAQHFGSRPTADPFPTTIS